MKQLKMILLLGAALTSLLAFTGCSACDNRSSSSSSPSSSSSSPQTSSSEFESSLVSPSSSEESSHSSKNSDSPSSVVSDISDDVSSAVSDISEDLSSAVSAMGVDFAQIGALDGNPVTWGPGHDMDEKNRPTACVGLQEQYGKYDCYFLGDQEKTIYLTFDEGYENGYTEKILDALKEKDVQAVFFVTMPYVKSQPELVQRMIDEGHIVGNHSDSHPVGGYPTLPLDAVEKDLLSLHNYMKENFNYDMTLFRYPEGAFTEQDAALLQQLGYKQLFWSFAYNDWNPDNQPDPAQAEKKLVGAAHDGAIYLLHAVSKTNTEVLPDFIDAMREKGFKFALFQ